MATVIQRIHMTTPKKVERLSKKQIDAQWKKKFLPIHISLEETNGVANIYERAKAYNRYIKSLRERGHITEEEMKSYLKSV